MLLSAEPLEQRHTKRASIHRRWATTTAAALVLLSTLLFCNYHLLWAFGDAVEARVDGVCTLKTIHKHGRNTVHTGVDATFQRADGVSLALQDFAKSAARRQSSSNRPSEVMRIQYSG
jgi:hypothetical protein